MSTATGPSRAATHPYTCVACQVAYRNADLQKGHMKSDWHRYNLLRRAAELTPITAEVFTEKVLQARAETAAQVDKALFEKTCEACQKKFFSENSYQNHLRSRKHKAREAQGGVQRKNGGPDDASSVLSSEFSLGKPLPTKPGVADEDEDEDEDSEDVDMEAEEEFNQVVEGLGGSSPSASRPSPLKRPSNPQAAAVASQATSTSEMPERGSGAATPTLPDGDKSYLQQCLFCRYLSPTVSLNAHHMTRFHGMNIPQKDYLVDLEGLLEHLHKKIYESRACITCDKVKANPFAVQAHMRDVSHCTIPYTTMAEQLDIGDFYDFRSTYSDGEEDEEDQEMVNAKPTTGSRLGARQSETVTCEGGKDGEGDVDDEGWETDSSATSFDSEELTAVPADDRSRQYDRLGKSAHHSHTDQRHHHMADGWHSHAHRHGHGAHAVYYDEYELHLPSGKSVGHRKFNRYYRQNLHSYPPVERAPARIMGGARYDPQDDEPADAMSVDGGESGESSGEQQLERRQRDGVRGRELMLPRGHGGLVGLSDQKKETVRRAVLKGRTSQQVVSKKQDYVRNKILNNQKSYYYRYTRGG